MLNTERYMYALETLDLAASSADPYPAGLGDILDDVPG
jgi:hypothetical protein